MTEQMLLMTTTTFHKLFQAFFRFTKKLNKQTSGKIMIWKQNIHNQLL